MLEVPLSPEIVTPRIRPLNWRRTLPGTYTRVTFCQISKLNPVFTKHGPRHRFKRGPKFQDPDNSQERIKLAAPTFLRCECLYRKVGSDDFLAAELTVTSKLDSHRFESLVRCASCSHHTSIYNSSEKEIQVYPRFPRQIRLRNTR